MSRERKEPVMMGNKPAAKSANNTPVDNGDIFNDSRRPQPVSARPQVVKSPVGGIALLFGLAGLALAGFVYWQFMQLQQQFELSSKAAETRIAQLESQLALTGDESTASVTALQAKLKWADSEIRKLWGVAHDTNRKGITANKEAIAKAARNAASANSAIKAYKKSSQLDISVINELVDAQAQKVKALDASNENAIQAVSRVQNTVNGVEKRITSNEQAIEAIDAFRRQVNADLMALKRGTAP